MQRRTLITLIITQVIGTVGVGIAPSMGILLAERVAETEVWAGLARSASTLGAALAGIPLGNLAARAGRRIALSAGWWVAAAGGFLVALAAHLDSVIALFLGLLILGAGSAVSLQARFAATDLAEPHHQGRALALVVWFGTAGNVIGPNLGTPGEPLGQALGIDVFAAAFGIAAVCLLVAGCLIFAFLRPDPLLTLQTHFTTDSPAPNPHAPNPNAPKSLVSTRQSSRAGGHLGPVFTEIRTNYLARYALSAILAAQAIMVALMTMTPVHMNHGGASIQLIGLTISLHVLSMYALAPLVGMCADRVGACQTITLGLLILLAATLTGALALDAQAGVITALILLGVGWSVVNVAASALFTRVISENTRASAQGGADALSNFASAIAAFVAGPLMALSNFSTLSLALIVLLVPTAFMTVKARTVSRSTTVAP